MGVIIYFDFSFCNDKYCYDEKNHEYLIFIFTLDMNINKNICTYFNIYWQISLQKDCNDYNTDKKYEYTRLIDCSEFVYEVFNLLSYFN